MTLNIMTLEAQLLAEIEERQTKLNKIRGVSPKLQQLEALLAECKATCSEFGMTDLFLGVLDNFTTTATTNTIPTQTTSTVAVNKESKTIRSELKEFLEYEGQRLNDKTAKELLIKKLEELNKTSLLSKVNLDDKENFLVEVKKLINLLTLATTEATTEATTNPLEEIYNTIAENKVTEEALSPLVEENLEKPLAKTVVTEEIKEIEGLDPLCVIKSALVQNKINGSYGTVEQDGVINGGALVRYPQETCSTPLTELVLIQSALPTPIIPTQEVGDYSPQTQQELTMWEELIEIFDGQEELIAMAQDEETIASYNLANNTSLSVLPIAELYEYATGKGRIS